MLVVMTSNDNDNMHISSVAFCSVYIDVAMYFNANTYRKKMSCCSFPKDEVRKQEWLRKLRRENFTPTKYSRICSRHFKEEDIDRTSLSTVRIRHGAVPSIFDAFPDHLKENAAPERKPPRKRTFSEHRSESESEQPVSECLDNLTETECLKSENEVLKHKLASVENKLTASRKKRKVLYEAKRRLKKRNGDLKSVISELKKKCYISEDP